MLLEYIFYHVSKYLDVLQNKAHGLHQPNELRHVQTFDSNECEHYESCNVDSKSNGELATIGRYLEQIKSHITDIIDFTPAFSIT